ncbi:MAG: DUF192 domain-containing protein [Acidobacteria bacterium]|nr:MAG: DUF192 domain-containing protein [Acidobacteriota bacterium]
MRWQKKTLRVVNSTRGTVVGESIRVAESGLTRIVGLLGESDLPPGDGLLIVPSQGVHPLGMLFAIDVVVLDGQWNVIAIRRRLRPFRMTRVFWKAAAILELRSGIVDSTSTSVGDSLELSRVETSQ